MCSHFVGLLKQLIHYAMINIKCVPNDLTCTKMQQTWHKPRPSITSSHQQLALRAGLSQCQPRCAFSNILREVPHVRHEFHYIHFRRNIKQQLQEHEFSPNAIMEIIDDLMATQKEQVFCEGLVDSASSTHFQHKLAMLKERWQMFDGGE